MNPDEVSDDDYANIPDDDDEAFIYLEKAFRKTLDIRMENVDSSDQAAYYKTGYANSIIAVVDSLQLPILSNWVTSKDRIKSHEHNDFMFDVDNAVTQIKIKLSRRNRQFSVQLDPVARTRIRHLVDQIKEHLDHLKLEDSKKEALVSKLNTFLAEVDRDRTKFQAYAALAIDVASISSEIASEIGPITKIFMSIAGVLGIAKADEQPRIGKPKEVKRLRGPTQKDRTPEELDFDKEIPF